MATLVIIVRFLNQQNQPFRKIRSFRSAVSQQSLASSRVTIIFRPPADEEVKIKLTTHGYSWGVFNFIIR
jgi:hypothetical protein